MTKFFIGALTLLVSLAPALSEESVSYHAVSLPIGNVMAIYDRALPPLGYVQFCAHNPAECRRTRSAMDRVQLDAVRWNELNDINTLVNNTVEPISDQNLYGVIEYWTFPAGQGDCEDYVLLKRRLLMERGWPERALLITVVRDENNEGHAVLTVRTLRGDFILDNKRDEILSFDRTDYTLVKRQSHVDVREWVSLVPQEDPANQVASWPR